jgi:hypothetical protein
MEATMTCLLPFDNLLSDEFTYNPEEKILIAILSKLGILDNDNSQFLEFGAVDGKHSSNCAILADKGWSGVFIEGSNFLFDLLEENYSYNSKVLCVQAIISPEAKSEFCLDKILKDTKLVSDFDVCSIDIDSFDLEVWFNLTLYRPKLVIIEINSSIPPGVLNWHGYGIEGGNSFSSTLQVGMAKGYTLVCAPGNLYFVRNDIAPLLELSKQFLEFPDLLFKQIKAEWMPTGWLAFAVKLKWIIKVAFSAKSRERYFTDKRKMKDQNLLKQKFVA